MTQEIKERRPHAVLNLETRYLKAKKIELLISPDKFKEPISLLEVGTGSGGIAYYFSHLSDVRYKVTAVDVKDSRLTTEGFDFQLVNGIGLPYDNESFDVVISNHVIEHVGDFASQLEHLCELNRVLKKSGIGYLAVPNRWMLVEPHYKLIFLSWLPRALRSPYLKFFGKGHYYDCEPLQKHEIESMFKKTHFEFKNVCVKALRLTFDIEMPNSLAARVIKFIPTYVMELFTPIIPTLIYTVRKSEERY